MDNDLIEKSIEKEELQLEFWNKITHFEIVLWLFAFAVFVPLMVLFYQIYDPTSTKTYGVLWFSPIFTAVGLIFYFIQKSRLKLTSIQTNLTRDEINHIIKKTCKNLGWQEVINTSKVFSAKTPFSGESWGEEITIIFDEKNILINSICDTNKKSSVVSYGRNRQNVLRIIDKIKNKENQNILLQK
jgi:hypothetical protein